jgi:thymidylate synthase (FAD)
MKSIDLYGDGIGKVELVDYVGSDLSVVNAARVSFGKHKEQLDANDEKLIKYLIKHRHTSTLEHNFVTFRFKVPLFVRSQHHRHRTWSYNEISRRYTEENLQFYEPTEFRTQHKSNRQASNVEELINPYILSYGRKASDAIKVYQNEAVNLYHELMEVGVCREQARGVLPQNLYTEYYGSCNAANLFKFISLRIHEGAQWEIVKVAEACLQIALELWPVTTRAYIELNDNEKMKQFIQK